MNAFHFIKLSFLVLIMSLYETFNSLQLILTNYVLTIVAVFGIVGNLLNTIIFCQKHFRKNSCSVYFISTSIVNLFIICFAVIPTIYASYSSYDLQSYSVVYCKFRSYFLQSAIMISRFSVALASIDRYALCSSNIRIRSFNKHAKAVKAMIIITCVWLILPSHILAGTNIYMPGRRCGANGLYVVIYTIYGAVVTVIPLVIMLVFSILAARNLRRVRSRVRVNHLTNSRSNLTISRIKKRDSQLVALAIGEVILYLISNTPFPIASFYAVATLSTPKTANVTIIENFIRYIIFNFLLYLNSCSIFYVHLIASKAFRHECKRMFLNFRRKNQVQPSDATAPSTVNRNTNIAVELHLTEYNNKMIKIDT